jgi:hypothetical protein
MIEFFSGGRAVDVILIVMAAETIGLFALRHKTRCNFAPLDVLLTLLPGVLLLLALRAALLQLSWQWIALFLCCAFPVHILDVWRRCKRAR